MTFVLNDNRPWATLTAAAEMAERAGRLNTAAAWREMAGDAFAMETHFKGGVLYRHWARQAAEMAMNFSTGEAAVPNKPAASDR